MKFEIQQNLKSTSSLSTLVLFVSQAKGNGKETNSPPVCHGLNAELKKVFHEALVEKSITGAASEVVFFRQASLSGFRHVLFLGVGDWKDGDFETLRSLGGTLESAISQAKLEGVMVDLNSLSEKLPAEAVQAFVEGLRLAAYRFDDFMENQKGKSKDTKIVLSLAHVTKAHRTAIEQAQIIAETVCFSRWLGDMPGNLMTPSIFAEEAKKAAKGTGVKVTIWDKARIKKEKMGGLIAVNRGSNEEPRVIVMEYKGAGLKEKPIALVGKGLTFDTGGISIKPSPAMEEMKFDMCGGANVVGAILAIARLKLKVNVVVIVPSTENMPSGNAIKPGDIIHARNGKTYEINNTDAEGRVILSDALTIASEMKPKALFDAATLTGAMMIALGNIHTGYFTRDLDLKNEIEEAAKASGEMIWHLPLCDHHTRDIKGTFADFSNIGATRGAGSATAAAFLEQFVEKGVPWAHFDIAGTGWATGGRLTYNSKKGASGVMIRTLIELAKRYQ